MQCPNCKAENEPGSVYCAECGFLMPKEETERVRPQPEPKPSPDPELVPALERDLEEERAKNKKQKGVIIALAVLLVIVLLYSMVTYDAYSNMESRYNSLNRKYNSLDDDYSEAKKEYEQAVSEYDQLKADYGELKRAYDQLFDVYDLEGRYAVKLTNVYNGDTDGNKISDELNADTLSTLYVEYMVHDPSAEWKDELYADVILANGKVMSPKEENDNHTWRHEGMDSSTGKEDYTGWFRTTWSAGTYKLVFYQNDTIIASFNIEIK